MFRRIFVAGVGAGVLVLGSRYSRAGQAGRRVSTTRVWTLSGLPAGLAVKQVSCFFDGAKRGTRPAKKAQ